jgi:hypothetical protein
MLDVQYRTGGAVTLIRVGTHFCTVRDEDEEWDTMKNRVSPKEGHIYGPFTGEYRLERRQYCHYMNGSGCRENCDPIPASHGAMYCKFKDKPWEVVAILSEPEEKPVTCAHCGVPIDVHGTCCGWNNAIVKCDAIIDNEHRWISVLDHFPDNEGNYLTVRNNKIYAIEHWYPKTSADLWKRCYGVTHWMPLPGLPKTSTSP